MREQMTISITDAFDDSLKGLIDQCKTSLF